MTSKTPNEIARIIISKLSAKISMADRFFIYHRLGELQPPTPPTCSACDFCSSCALTREDDSHEGVYECIRTDNHVPFIDLMTMEQTQTWGCNKHSDYGVEDE